MTQPVKWQCEVCGYIHEGAQPPETCPMCGVSADMFSPYREDDQLPTPPDVTARAWRCSICNEVVPGDSAPPECPACGAAASLFVPHEPSKTSRDSTETSDRIVVVGGGVAGFTAAEYARRNSSSASITLIHKELELPYNRLNLTRMLAGEVDEGELPLRPDPWYVAQGIETLAGEVVRVHRAERELVLRDGSRLAYDRLVLANGSHAFVPPIPGVSRAGVLSLRTRQDALRILERAQAGARCLCIGGGLLGLETAGALARRGARVTVLEGFEWLLPRQLARPAADLLRGYLESLGIRVQCGVMIEKITGDEEVRGVRKKGGGELEADLVVLATGVRPNSYLARQSSLEVESGVVVDDYMQTSDNHIYAAGDVAEHRGIVYGLWPTALGQGAVAGTNSVTGNSQQFSGVPPASRLKVLDVAMFSIGHFQGSDASFRVFEHETSKAYYRLVCRDGRLVGANLYGDTEPAGVVKTAVEEGRQVAEYRQLFQPFEVLSSCLEE